MSAKKKQKPNNELTEFDADRIITKDAIHWLICIETYARERRKTVGATGVWELVQSEKEICVYKNKTRSHFIVGFRGTHDKKDFYDDAVLSVGKTFPRGKAAISFVKNLKENNTPCTVIEATGHSLGGAIARVVCDEFKIRTVTFNAAAPPSYPVKACDNSTNYHIVYDIISAWQSPGTVRIYKYHDPIAPWWARATLLSWAFFSFTDILDSHSLKNFSDDTPGYKVTGAEEDSFMTRWWMSLPKGFSFLLEKLVGVINRNYASFLPKGSLPKVE